mgnify:CR=1 FL=1
MLIPFDSTNTVYTTNPGYAGSYVQPTVYRKLTMDNGANIVVNGAISVGSQICTANFHNGAPSGPSGFIDMESGSSITINNGAKLYAWGFITGSGNVTITNGGRVYENLQIRDWRGGNCTSSMEGNDQGVFVFSQYFVQNIEASLTLESGAILKDIEKRKE